MATHTFVLVHGAWHGGWCWKDVAERLRAAGHAVTAPTLTGLGERAHLLSDRLDLATCITDIRQHIVFEELDEIVLVGHSFAGPVITGVADAIPERIRRLIYLDALLLDDGESAMSRVPPAVAEQRLRLAQESSGGLTMPVPPASVFGIADKERAAWVESKLTPHPLKTYVSPLRIKALPGNGLRADYVVCTNPAYVGAAPAHERARQSGWPLHELATSHDAMVTAPAATAELFVTIAAG